MFIVMARRDRHGRTKARARRPRTKSMAGVTRQGRRALSARKTVSASPSHESAANLHPALPPTPRTSPPGRRAPAPWPPRPTRQRWTPCWRSTRGCCSRPPDAGRRCSSIGPCSAGPRTAPRGRWRGGAPPTAPILWAGARSPAAATTTPCSGSPRRPGWIRPPPPDAAYPVVPAPRRPCPRARRGPTHGMVRGGRRTRAHHGRLRAP